MRRSFARFLVVLTFAITAAMGSLAEAPKDDARLKHGFRRPQQNGWTFVHLQGTPLEIGFQHGYLLAAGDRGRGKSGRSGADARQ